MLYEKNEEIKIIKDICVWVILGISTVLFGGIIKRIKEYQKEKKIRELRERLRNKIEQLKNDGAFGNIKNCGSIKRIQKKLDDTF